MKLTWYSLCLLVLFQVTRAYYYYTLDCEIGPIKDYDVIKEKLKQLQEYSGSDYPLVLARGLLNRGRYRTFMIVCLNEKYLKALDFILKYRADEPYLEPASRLREELLRLLIGVEDEDTWNHYFSTNKIYDGIDSSGNLFQDNVPSNLVGSFNLPVVASILESGIFHDLDLILPHIIQRLLSYVRGNLELLNMETSDRLEGGKFKFNVLLDFFALCQEETSSKVIVYPELLHMVSLLDECHITEELRPRLERPFNDFYTALNLKAASINELVGVKMTSSIFKSTAQAFYGDKIDKIIKPFIMAMVENQGKPYVIKGELERVSDFVKLLFGFLPESYDLTDLLKDIFETLLIRASSDVENANIAILDAISYSISPILRLQKFYKIPETCFADGHLRGSVFYALARNTYYSGPDLKVLSSPATCAEVFSLPDIVRERAQFFPRNYSGSSLRKLVDPRVALSFILTQRPINLTAIKNIFTIFKAEDDFEVVRYSREVSCEVVGDTLVVDIELSDPRWRRLCCLHIPTAL